MSDNHHRWCVVCKADGCAACHRCPDNAKSSDAETIATLRSQLQRAQEALSAANEKLRVGDIDNERMAKLCEFNIDRAEKAERERDAKEPTK